jgi:hypothetical protein
MKLYLRAQLAASLPGYLTQEGDRLYTPATHTKNFMSWLSGVGLQILLLKGFDSVLVLDTGEVLWDLEGQRDYDTFKKNLKERRSQRSQGVLELDPQPFEELDCTPPRGALNFKIQTCPFPESKIQSVMFRGDLLGLTQFKRLSTGIWFASSERYAESTYANKKGKGVYSCWLDLRNPYVPSEEEEDDYYAAQDPEILDPYLTKIKAAGYDAWVQMQNITVFDSVKIMNAETGEVM